MVTDLSTRLLPVGVCLILLSGLSGCDPASTRAGDLRSSTSQVASRDAVLLHADFDHDSDTGFAKRLLSHSRIDLAPGAGPDGSNAIRVTYAGYPRGSERVVVGYPLDRSVEEAILQFDVKFEDDFQFVRGGKLHGLGPDHKVTGGHAMTPAGWSARAMFKEAGRLSAYVYQQNKTSRYGVGAKTDGPVFEKGRWHTVRIHVKLNSSADQANGWVTYTVDGQTVIRHTHARLRGVDDPSARISQMLFSTFHGGNKPKWAPVDDTGAFVNVHALFDNFQVLAGPSDCD